MPSSTVPKFTFSARSWPPVVVGRLLEVGAAADHHGLVAGGQRLEAVGAAAQAEVGKERDAQLLGQAVDQGERPGRVLAHLQEPLAAQDQEVRRAGRVEAEEEGALARQAGKWRSPKALIPSLKDSSEPAESRITRTPSGGLDEALGQGQQGDDRGAVVVGAGDHLAEADVGHRRDGAEAEQEPEPGEQASAAEGAERGQQRAADDRRHQHRAGVGLLDQAEAVGDQRDLGVEDEA